jgi:hypothetical protein
MGIIIDRNGREIMPGDLLKTFHFFGARKKRYYLYHVATIKEGFLMMTPVSWLEPSFKREGGECRIEQSNMNNTEIISGDGPNGDSYFEDRPKAKKVGII